MAQKRLQSRGFTILELMVATMVFSIMLVLLSTIVITITRLFYKGVISIRTQQVARSISEEIGRTVQFSPGNISQTAGGGTPADPIPRAICVDQRGFYYVLGRKLVDSPTVPSDISRATLLDTDCNTGITAQQFRDSTGAELLGKNMRLLNIDIDSVGANGYRIATRVAYGDDDLLDDPSTAGEDPSGPNASCKSTAGSQFCAVSEITITVFKRL